LWPILREMTERWTRDPRYAHGYLVPIFSIALLWNRRSLLAGTQATPSTSGLVILAVGAACQLAGGYFRFAWIEGVAVLPYLAGVCICLGGWPAFKWAWQSIGFLIFMVPLPWSVEEALGAALQSVATDVSVYVINTFGFEAYAQGNVIQLTEARIGVVEACSGLSMLLTSVALSTAAAMLAARPRLDRVVLVMSSIPVAVLANVARIVATGILHDSFGSFVANRFYHDLAGWLMIPFALFLYWCELRLLSHLLPEAEPSQL
jgi:exosortase